MENNLQEIEQPVETKPINVKHVAFNEVSNIKHIQAPGAYARATFVQGHVRFYTKKHPVSHISILSHGELIVDDGKQKTHLRAPAHYIVPADTRVVCYSLTDIVFYCIHATEETDVDKLSQLY